MPAMIAGARSGIEHWRPVDAVQGAPAARAYL